jgi:hypothetical protein
MKNQFIKAPFSFFIGFIRLLLLLIVVFGCQKQSTPEDPAKLKPFPPTTIVYSNLNQDTIITGINTDTLYTLDLNNDGIPDFTFAKKIKTYRICNGDPDNGTRGNKRVPINLITMSPGNGNAVADYSISADSTFPLPFSDLAVISSATALWSDSINQILNVFAPGTLCGDSYESGLLIPENLDNKTAFLGLRLVIGSNAYYGWVKISVALGGPVGGFSTYNLTIMGFAYNKNPGQSIRAGQLR